MPEMQKDKFEFPDEIEEKESSSAAAQQEEEASDGKFEIEIEDDTPPEDRNREPLPEPIKNELERDEIDEYDDKVKEKFKQMRKVWHDERREKERIQRENQEAVNMLQRIMEENKKYRSLIETGSKEYATTLETAANLELEVAKRAYREAYEAGDTDRIIDAQQAMQHANLKVLQAKNFKAPPLQEENFDVQPSQQVQSAPVDRKLAEWQEKNPWYGQDEEMTAAALGLHRKLEREGQIVIGSEKYYAELNKTIRKRFPEYFSTNEESTEEVKEVKGKSESAPTKPSTVVAPAVRSTASNKIRLQKRQVDLAKKLGLTPEQYALELRKLEAQNG